MALLVRNAGSPCALDYAELLLSSGGGTALEEGLSSCMGWGREWNAPTRCGQEGLLSGSGRG